MRGRRITISALAVWAGAASAWAADIGTESELYRAIVQDSTVTMHLRTYYFDEQVPSDPDKEAWAGGGWLGYKTGWIDDILQFGVVGYTSQPIWAPSDTDGTLLLRPGQLGYGVIGQAYAALKFNDQVLTLYRQSVDQPEVNPQDNRMTPNTFEGVTMSGNIQELGYFAGYLTQMKPRNSDNFETFASAAGATGGSDNPMWIAGLNFDLPHDLKARASAYMIQDILASAYADAEWSMPLTENAKFRFAGQFMYQGSAGGDDLNGTSFNTWVGGLVADFIFDGLTLTAAMTQTGDEFSYQSPYGTWPGYSNMIIKAFDRAGETAFVAGATFDFASVGLAGLSMNAAVAFGDNAVDPSTGASLSQNTEYDFTADYRFSALSDEKWLSPLWLEARAGRLEEDSGGTTTVTNEYRLILNYEWQFGGAN